MTNETFWVLARAAGTASVVALAVSLLSGMALRSGVLVRFTHNRATNELHTFSNALWLPLALVHVIALLFDGYAQVRLIDLVVPFAVPYARIAIGLGTISVLLLAVVFVTAFLRDQMPRELWLSLHQLSYPAFVAAFAHTVLSGTDFSAPPVAALMWATAIALAWVWTKRVASMYRSPVRGDPVTRNWA